ncbi:hypothetical protein RCH10_005555, partial [Variovorax sp. GrIS 2.14]
MALELSLGLAFGSNLPAHSNIGAWLKFASART